MERSKGKTKDRMSKEHEIWLSKRAMDALEKMDVQKNEKLYNQVRAIYTSALNAFEKEAIKHGRKKAHALSIATFDKMLEHFTKDGDISCRKGCSFCCHIRVDSWATEIKYIIDYCNKNGIAIDKRYLKEQAQIGADKIFHSPSHSACVFLKNGICSIYEARPCSCRSHFVVSNPKYCDTIENTGQDVIWAVNIPAEISISAIEDPNPNDRGWMVNLLLKNL
jgi:Fe-S-cluster containining protein